jgi:hypothetical protein
VRGEQEEERRIVHVQKEAGSHFCARSILSWMRIMGRGKVRELGASPEGVVRSWVERGGLKSLCGCGDGLDQIALHWIDLGSAEVDGDVAR